MLPAAVVLLSIEESSKTDLEFFDNHKYFLPSFVYSAQRPNGVTLPLRGAPRKGM